MRRRTFFFLPVGRQVFKKNWLTACLSIIYVAAMAQTDSIPMPIARLDEDDILAQKEAEKRTIVRCATRTEQEIGEVMNTVFVVTGAEILRNGWITLTDVLRNVPGIRVSQPGNALEGETFLMEGANGNQEVEILINDIPIRPTGAMGMPIGAQLPIRQAERIEVLYGPGGGYYGRQANAGIVNIILKETERPLFTQADLNFGRNGYTSLDLFFGGKLGRDRNIFRFAIYGSSTVADDRDLFHANERPELFEANRYLLPGQDSFFYLLADHFEGIRRPDPDGSESSRALLAKTPHESRHFGINMRWHGLQLSYNRLYRSDHSSIGLSPLAASYANSQTFIGEKIETFSLGARRVRPRGGMHYTLSAVFYKIDDRSTEAWVSPMLTTSFMKHIDPDGQFTEDDRGNWLFYNQTIYYYQTRYLMATSADFRQEIRWNRRYWKALQIELGQVSEVDWLRPLARYSLEPAQSIGYFRKRSNFSSFLQDYDADLYGILSAYGQAHLRVKKFQFLASKSWSLDLDFHSDQRLFVGYSPFDWLQLRGGRARVSRQMPLQTNTNGIHLKTSIDTIYSVTGPEFAFLSYLPNERTRSDEFGIRINKPGLLEVDLSFFRREKSNFAANGYFTERPIIDDFVKKYDTYGWQSDQNSRRTIRGFQAVVRPKEVPFEFVFLKKSIEFKWENHLFFTHSKGKTRMPGSSQTLDGIAGLPENILRFQTGFTFPKTTILLRFNYESDAPTGEFYWKERWPRQSSRDLDKGRQTIDFVFRRSMSKNFQIYFTMNNVFDRNFSGIDATGTPDDLFFNPQPTRQTRLGINYNMN